MGMWLISLQLQVSVAVVVIFLLRAVMKKMPKVYSYGLWVLVFVRLLLPFSLETSFSFMPSTVERDVLVEQVAENIHIVSNQMISVKPMQEPVTGDIPENMEAASQKPISTPSETVGTDNVPQTDNRYIFMLIWSAGVVGILGYNGVSLNRLKCRIRSAQYVRESAVIGTGSAPVYVCAGIRVPFTLGFLNPKIYLPVDLTEAEQEYILCHEYVHIRRKDNLVKNLAFILTALYWFNPFVWVAFFLMERDMEMSCDEQVLQKMGSDIKRCYSQSLLNFAEGKSPVPATPLHFGENSVKQRVKNVLSYKNAKRWSIGFGLLILVGVTVALFTTGKQPQEENAADEEIESSVSEEVNIPVQEEEVIYKTWEYVPVYGQAPEYVIQATNQGIYRVDGEGKTCLYPYYTDKGISWDLRENILYFTVDTGYGEGDKKYVPDYVCILNVITGEYNSKAIPLTSVPANSAPIQWISAYAGFLSVGCNGKEYYLPLINTGEELLGLSEEEKDAVGVKVRRQLIEGKQIFKLSNRTESETFVLIDLDGDDKAEKISLSKDETSGVDPIFYDWTYDYYRFQVEESVITGYGECLHNDIWAFCPDGKNIILMLMENGASDDYRTHFFSYKNGELYSLGTIYSEIENIRIEGETVYIPKYINEFLQPCYISVPWNVNESGKMEEVKLEEYAINCSRSILPNLLVELPVHTVPGGGEVTYIQPQKVDFIKFDDTFRWVYVEAEDGSSGWFEIEAVKKTENDVSWQVIKIVELNLEGTEVFEVFYAG